MTAELHAKVAEARLARDRTPIHIRSQAPGRRVGPRRQPTPTAGHPQAGIAGCKQSSVYRNLAALEQAGVVRRVLTDEEFGRYELTEELTGHHHHLVCSNCGAVEDVDFAPGFEETLESQLAELADRTGFSAVSHRLDLIGLCRVCAAAASA